LESATVEPWGHRMSSIENEIPFHRPLSGAEVARFPSALIPARSALAGRHVSLEPLDAARHAADLFEASHATAAALHIWDYLPVGPWGSQAEYTKVLRQQTARHEQIYYAIRPAEGGKACGQTSFLDIAPENGVIEIGSIWFGLSFRRTKGATEALYLILAYPMDEPGYRPMQVRCHGRN